MQEWLNHASISITLDIYSHVVAGMDAEAAASVARLFTTDDELSSDEPAEPRRLRSIRRRTGD